MADLDALLGAIRKDPGLQRQVFDHVRPHLYPKRSEESARFDFELALMKKGPEQENILQEY